MMKLIVKDRCCTTGVDRKSMSDSHFILLLYLASMKLLLTIYRQPEINVQLWFNNLT